MLNAKATLSRDYNLKLHHLEGETKLYLYIILPYCVVILKQLHLPFVGQIFPVSIKNKTTTPLFKSNTTSISRKLNTVYTQISLLSQVC